MRSSPGRSCARMTSRNNLLVKRRAALSLLLFAGASLAQNAEPSLQTGATLRVRLEAPLTTKFNRKGDIVSARVLEPAGFQGGMLEGDIREVKAGGSGAG